MCQTQQEDTKEDGELSDDYDNQDDEDGATVTGSTIQSPPRLYRSKLHDTEDDNSSSAYSESDRYSGMWYGNINILNSTILKIDWFFFSDASRHS